MEETEQIQQTLPEEKSPKEKLDEQEETNTEDKDIYMLEAKQLQHEIPEKTQEEETEVKVDHQAMEEAKVGESQINSSKKAKQSSKQSPKTKVTIPQPFSLATEKRMSRERRGSVDFNDSKTTLSQFSSFNYKNMAQSSLGAERTSYLRNASSSRATTKTSLKPKVTTEEQVDRNVESGSTTKAKIQVENIEKKKPQAAAKKQEAEELGSNKFRKSSTFKALPLPSFYNHESPEINKIPLTKSKSPSLGQQGKTVPKPENNKTEEKGKKVSRGISSSAKATISKLLKTTRSSLGAQKQMVKSVV